MNPAKSVESAQKEETKKSRKKKKKSKETKKQSDDFEEEKKIIEPKIQPTISEESKIPKTTSCLKMEAKYLNSEREFNKLFKEFGVAEGESEEKLPAVEEGAGVHLSKKAKKRLEKYKDSMEKSKKMGIGKLVLAQSDLPKHSIPKIITMRQCDPDEFGHTVFTYDLTEEYQIVQKRFTEAQKSNNIAQLYEFLNTHYYHPEGLLAISEFSRLKGTFVESTKLLERCLTVFEATWNYTYSIFKDPPNTRLDLKNSKLCQVFGEALFRYIDVVGRRGCSRTALEYCKLVLSFWPEEDPFGILTIFDYYALRAREYTYFVDFISGAFVNEIYSKISFKTEKFKSLLLMPNLIYSCALAKKMAQNSTIVPKESQLMEDYAKILSVTNIDEIVNFGENAILLLAIILYPSMLRHIINKIKSPTGSSWEPTLKNLKEISKSKSGKYYGNYIWICKDKNPECAHNSLKKIYSIYEEKAATCFTSESVQSWLRAVCTFLADGLSKGELDLNLIREQIANNCICPFYLDRYSHLNVLDFKEDLTTIPPEELNPLIEGALFAPQAQAPPAEENEGPPPNPLLNFFRTMFH